MPGTRCQLLAKIALTIWVKAYQEVSQRSGDTVTSHLEVVN